MISRSATLAREVRDTYSEKGEDWAQARRDRNEYLLAVNSNDPRLERVDQITTQLADMLPDGAKVLDLGFGPEGRDMVDLGVHKKSFQVFGADLVEANIRSTLKNPEIGKTGKALVQADIVVGVPFRSGELDAIILSSVIQHLTPEEFYGTVLPGLRRLLKPDGLVQLIFKRTDEETYLYKKEADPTMGGVERNLWMYNPEEVVEKARNEGLNLFMGDDDNFGGILTWNDQKRPEIGYAALYLSKIEKVGNR